MSLNFENKIQKYQFILNQTSFKHELKMNLYDNLKFCGGVIPNQIILGEFLLLTPLRVGQMLFKESCVLSLNF